MLNFTYLTRFFQLQHQEVLKESTISVQQLAHNVDCAITTHFADACVIACETLLEDAASAGADSLVADADAPEHVSTWRSKLPPILDPNMASAPSAKQYDFNEILGKSRKLYDFRAGFRGDLLALYDGLQSREIPNVVKFLDVASTMPEVPDEPLKFPDVMAEALEAYFSFVGLIISEYV